MRTSNLILQQWILGLALECSTGEREKAVLFYYQCVTLLEVLCKWGFSKDFFLFCAELLLLLDLQTVENKLALQLWTGM